MVRHLKDGENFGDSPDHFPESFGFSSSSKPDRSRHALRKAEGGDVDNGDGTMTHHGLKPYINRRNVPMDEYAGTGKAFKARAADQRASGDKAGADETINAWGEYNQAHGPNSGMDRPYDKQRANMRAESSDNFARGGASHIHPFGHQVAGVEQHGDGGMTYHHAHGGSTHIAPNGGVTHHDHTGAPMHGGDGGEQGMVREAAQLAKNMKRHEAEEAQGERSEGEGYAMGGPRRPPMPHGHHMAPRMPMKMGDPAPKGQVTGGALPYGVGASDEPAIAGSGQGMPQLAKGGAGRKRRA